MSKLLFVAIALFLTTTLSPAWAQQDPSFVLIGQTTLNGVIPPVGTLIVARDGDTKLASALTKEGGKFILHIERPPTGSSIEFEVGGVVATTTLPASRWKSGVIYPDLKLNVNPPRDRSNQGPPVPAGTLGYEGPLGPASAPGPRGVRGPVGGPGPITEPVSIPIPTLVPLEVETVPLDSTGPNRGNLQSLVALVVASVSACVSIGTAVFVWRRLSRTSVATQ